MSSLIVGGYTFTNLANLRVFWGGITTGNTVTGLIGINDTANLAVAASTKLVFKAFKMTSVSNTNIYLALGKDTATVGVGAAVASLTAPVYAAGRDASGTTQTALICTETQDANTIVGHEYSFPSFDVGAGLFPFMRTATAVSDVAGLWYAELEDV